MIWFVVIWSALCIAAASLVMHKQSKYNAALKRNLRQVYAERNRVLENNEKLKTEQVQKLSGIRREYEQNLHEKDARVEKIIAENSNLQWKRDVRNREQYTIAISVNPRMFGGVHTRMDREDLIYIAKHIGDQVAHELASYKYIQRANEYERQFGR